jgi:hypothetical protein
MAFLKMGLGLWSTKKAASGEVDPTDAWLYDDSQAYLLDTDNYYQL